MLECCLLAVAVAVRLGSLSEVYGLRLESSSAVYMYEPSLKWQSCEVWSQELGTDA